MNIRNVEEFGKYLEDLRGNVSANQIANGICSPGHLRLVEKCKRVPGDEILYKIANRLNVKPKELIFAIKRIQVTGTTK